MKQLMITINKIRFQEDEATREDSDLNLKVPESFVKTYFMTHFLKQSIAIFLIFACAQICFGQQNGIVKTERSAPRGIVSFSASSVLTGISNTKHVDGYVKKYGNTLFAFPVGHNGAYRPFAAEADATTGAYFQESPGTATLQAGAPFPPSSKETAIANVSSKEYWDIDGANTTLLTLTWNSVSNIAGLTGNNLSLLSIAGWNATTSRWEKIPSIINEVPLTGGSSSLTAGSLSTIQKIIPNSYSVFTLAALTSESLPASYTGNMETASCSEIKGWAWDKNYPNASVTLELMEGSSVHATTTANIFRQDLQNAGIGTGDYGFSFNIPASLRDGKPHQLSIRVRSSNYFLIGSPKSMTCSFGGNLEEANCFVVQGWAWDQDNPNVAQQLEVVEGNTVHATITANNYRQDLKDAGTGTGNYGFSFGLPPSLKNGQVRQFSMRVKGSTYNLPGSPKSVTCISPQYNGSFDWASCTEIKGWVWDKNNPNVALPLELVEGNTVYATTIADIYREDLQRNGAGDGRHAFSLQLPAALKDGQPHQISIRVQGSSYPVPGGPKTVTCTLPSDYQGTLETASCTEIKGWVWDKNYQNAALDIEVVEAGVVLATATANTFRQDLKNAGTGTGNYGFSIPLPAALKNGQPHTLNVRVKGSTYSLSGAPKTITCPPPSQYGGSFDWASCTEIKGWVWDKNNPNVALPLELVEGNTVYATTIADIYREDLQRNGAGDGRHAFSLQLPAALKDGQPHQISIRVQGSSYLVPGGPKTVTCTLPSDYQGTLETASCTEIKGWVWDKNYQNAALDIEVVEAGVVLATATANTFRQDLKSAGTGTGNYGFSIPLPAALKNGQPHTLNVRVKGSTYSLSGAPKTVTCPPPSQYGGSFDWASCTEIKGWVWDKNNPNVALPLELVEGNTVYATTIADIYREDLQRNGAGDGRHAFSLQLPAALKDGQPHQISIRVQGSSYLVPGGPKTVTCTLPSDYQGTLETASCTEIKGWVWDKNYQNAALDIEVVEAGVVLATATANTFRQDLKNAGTGTGNYGFSIPLPAALKNGQPHTLNVRVKGSTYSLSGAPKTVTCPPPSQYGGSFDWASCTEIKGWVWDKNNPNVALPLELVEGNTVYATTIADIYREDLQRNGAGDGRHAFSLQLPAALKDGQPHQISIRVQGSSYLVPGGPKTVTCTLPSDYQGTLETASCTEIKGWVWDKNYQNAALDIEVVEAGVVLATATANTFRQDLKNAGTGTGNYGFSIPLPAALKNGQPHTLNVRVKGSTYSLSGAPKTITCPPPSQYGGSFDWASCTEIKGWAWDKNSPNQPLNLELVEGNTVYATTIADIYREDLQRNGAGDGRHAFSLQLPSALKDGQPHQISIRVQGSSYLVPGGPKTVTCTLPSDYQGTLETASCTEIKGWVWDKNYQNAALDIEVVEAGVVLATATANTFRQDLKNAGTGTGNYGFSIPLPAALKNGQPHTLNVRVKGSTYSLSGAPKTITCPPPSQYGGSFDWASCTEIKGWVWDKNNPNVALPLELVEGNTVYATTIADIYREDLQRNGAGDGRHAFSLQLPAALKDGQPHQISIRVQGSSYLVPGGPKTVTCPPPSGRVSAFTPDATYPETEPEADSSLLVSPNPTNGKFLVNFSLEKQKPALLVIINILGRVVWQESVSGTVGEQQKTVDISLQPEGVYLVQLKTGKESRIKRIVLIK